MNIGMGSRRSEQEDRWKKNGLEEKFYKEEREQVWSVLKEIVLRIRVIIIRWEEVYVNLQM